GSAAPAQQDRKGAPLQWAYGTGAPATATGSAAASRDSSPRHISGSSLSFTFAQVHDHFGPADWHPDDHGAMPEIVAHGRKPDVTACALCHLANGEGRPVNAALAGLPLRYFTLQMMDFKAGDRKSSDPTKSNTKIMVAIAKEMTNDEIAGAAKYF